MHVRSRELKNHHGHEISLFLPAQLCDCDMRDWNKHNFPSYSGTWFIVPFEVRNAFFVVEEFVFISEWRFAHS